MALCRRAPPVRVSATGAPPIRLSIRAANRALLPRTPTSSAARPRRRGATRGGQEFAAMAFDTVRWLVSRRPEWVVAAWVLAALAIGLAAPNLTRLAAEGQAKLTPEGAESSQAAALIRTGWPD